jgi:copper(I)-binding protein
MNDYDGFDERLQRRLTAFDAAVPEPAADGLVNTRRTSRHGVASALPLGFLAALLVAVAIVGIFGASFAHGSNVAGSQPVGSGTPSSSATATNEASHGIGISVSGARAYPLVGTGNPIIVVARITNNTSQRVKLLGASSAVASSGKIYSRLLLEPVPTDASGLGGMEVVTYCPMNPGESIDLAKGNLEIVLGGVAEAVTPGQLVVTFLFDSADPVTLTVQLEAN